MCYFDLLNEKITQDLTLGMMYSISETCSCEPRNFFLFFFGAVCIEQKASCVSRNESIIATVVATRVAKHAKEIKQIHECMAKKMILLCIRILSFAKGAI